MICEFSDSFSAARYQILLASDSQSILTDLDFFLDPLSISFFPNLPRGIRVHGGFGDQHEL